MTTRFTIDPQQFLRRVLADALLEAEIAYWLKRAHTFRQAAPKPGDYLGHATPEEVAEQINRCLATAHACEAKARYLQLYADDRTHDVDVEVKEVWGPLAA